MSFTGKNIYDLLPAIYRIRDAEQGNPLKGFIDVIAREALVTEENISELYENWFIETCKEWVVPYIGDLLGVRGLNPVTGSNLVSQRAYVANTLGYRRRKGIAPILEQLALDVAGWRAHVTEFFEFLQASQYMNHLRPACLLTPDLRKMNQLDLINTAFDTIAHSADVRHISSGRGRYNIPNIGLFIWRIQSYPVIKSDARKVECITSPADPAKYFFTFNPTGCDIQLFNRPKTETVITHISEEINVPALLRTWALSGELEARRQAIVDGTAIEYNYFDDRPEIEDDPATRKHPVFEIFPAGETDPVDPGKILICNLSSCCTPPVSKKYKRSADGTEVDMPIKVVVDPVRGRFAFTDVVEKAQVSYSYGFSADLGAGIYKMPGSVPGYFETLNFPPEAEWHARVSRSSFELDNANAFDTLEEAINRWNDKTTGSAEGITGIITLMDNCSYDETSLPAIEMKEKSKLLIIAANCPVDAAQETLLNIANDVSIGELRPHIIGNISVAGPADTVERNNSILVLNGLLLEGKLSVSDGNLGELVIAHSTLVPGMGGIEVGTLSPPSPASANQWLNMRLIGSITGPVMLNNIAAESLEIEDCIIDNGNEWAIYAAAAPVSIKRSTVFGKTNGKTLYADNSIFTGIVEIERRQTGCMRFCYSPLDNSSTPRRYHCQPDLEINTRIAALPAPVTEPTRTSIKNSVTPWLVPGFRSVKHCHYGYAQLSSNCPVQVSAGADDGSEMGAFCLLKQPQRMANLRIALNEYLPLGLEAGIIFST